MPTKEDLVSFFYQHLVPIHITFNKGKDIQKLTITSFVLSVKTHWFLVTAAHCIEEVEKIVNIHGYKIATSFLIDSLGLDAKHREPIPFDFKNSFPVSLSSKRELDYGVIELNSYYKRLLLANKVRPLDERSWKIQPNSLDFYMLLGIPSESIKEENSYINMTPPLVNIEYLESRPDDFPKTDFPLFYGRAILGNAIKSIKGMSGGPIFGFCRNEKDEVRYWVIALQSRWLPKSGKVMACPIKLLGLYLEYIIENR